MIAPQWYFWVEKSSWMIRRLDLRFAMVKKSILCLAILLLSAFSFAQQGDSKSKTKQLEDAAWARAGCGPDSVRFDVKIDKHQHTLAQPESGKALVYVFENDLSGNAATTRVGLDSKWVGGNVPLSYMFFSVTPGSHRLCSNWQSWSQYGAAVDFNAEAGRIYFFHARINSSYIFTLRQVPEAEGHFLIASHGLSTSAEKSHNNEDD